MTKLLTEAFEALKRLPETDQERAVRAIMEFASSVTASEPDA